MRKKPPKTVVGCEYCKYRTSEFEKDKEDKDIIRCYCSARHTNVNAELMTKYCDFFEKNPDYKYPENEVTVL